MSHKIFITGAAGFIGSNLVQEILKTYSDAHILSYDLLTYAGHLENLSSVMDNPRHRFIKGDISDYHLARKTLISFKPDIIFHLAAESHVDRSINASAPFIQTNIVGHVKFLEAVNHYYQDLSDKERDSFRFIHLSTDEVFGALGPEDEAFNEHSSYDPRSPYSASKAAGDHMVRAWEHTHHLPSIIVNCSNNYGPYQFPEKLIPLMISRALSMDKLPVYGEGEQIRDWIYVADHCKALMAVMEKGQPGQSYCIGGSTQIRNIDLVQELCRLLDHHKPRGDGKKYEQQIAFVEDRPGHDFRYAMNTKRANESLGWAAETSFLDGLEKTVLWYLNNQEWLKTVQDAEGETL